MNLISSNHIISLSFMKSYTYLDTNPANSSFSHFTTKVIVSTSFITSNSMQATSFFWCNFIYKNCLILSSVSADAITETCHMLNNSSKVSSEISSICFIILVIDDLYYHILVPKLEFFPIFLELFCGHLVICIDIIRVYFMVFIIKYNCWSFFLQQSDFINHLFFTFSFYFLLIVNQVKKLNIFCLVNQPFWFATVIGNL